MLGRPPSDGEAPSAEFCALAEMADCAVLLLDLGGRIRLANSQFGQLMGLSDEAVSRLEHFEDLAEIMGGPASTVQFTQRLAVWWPESRRRGESWKTARIEKTWPVARQIERMGRPVMDVRGEICGWLETYRELPGSEAGNPQVLQAEKMAALGVLVSGVAHELNNPLTSISGYAQVLLARMAGTRIEGELRWIQEEAGRASRIVRNLLFFARQSPPVREPVDLNDVVGRAVSLRQYDLRMRGIALNTRLAPRLPQTLADGHQLLQVILNLIVNAEQALASRRGGRIEISTRPSGADLLRIEISDDGPGVPPDIAARIFDPFFTTKLDGTGTGLGLSLCNEFVQEHGGRVFLAPVNTLPGARFVVELPLLAPPAVAASRIPAPVAPVPMAAPEVVGRRRILVTEDEPVVLNLISDVLTAEGHEVIRTTDGLEALHLLLPEPGSRFSEPANSTDSFDLLICDLKMPHLDGQALFDALMAAQHPACKRLLFITGDTLGKNTFEFLDRHSLPYLAKPFLVEELLSAVNGMLKTNAYEKSKTGLGNPASSVARHRRERKGHR